MRRLYNAYATNAATQNYAGCRLYPEHCWYMTVKPLAVVHTKKENKDPVMI